MTGSSRYSEKFLKKETDMKIFGVDLLKQDLLEGFIYGLFSLVAVGVWGFLIAIITAILWALGGAGFLGFNITQMLMATEKF